MLGGLLQDQCRTAGKLLHRSCELQAVLGCSQEDGVLLLGKWAAEEKSLAVGPGADEARGRAEARESRQRRIPICMH